jgi:Tfp pilus assembly protein PilX
MKHIGYRQQGVTLIIALIMLVLLTLLVLTSVNLGKASLQTVGNMQQRNETYAAAQETIEQVISSTRFFDTPDNVFPNPCEGANTKCIDTNGDSVNDVKVTLDPKPACVKAQRARIVLESSGGGANQQALSCATGNDSDDPAKEMGQDTSVCWDSTWEIQAKAVDVVTQAKVTVAQGVNVRVSEDAIATSCP